MASYPPPTENLPLFNSLVFTETLSSSTYSSTQPSFSSTPTGAIIAYFGQNAPAGWLICNGNEFNPTEYEALYNLLNSSYTPDLRGTFLRGSGTNSSYTNVAGQALTGQAVGSYAQDCVGKHYHLYNANQDDVSFELGTTGTGIGSFTRLQYMNFNGTRVEAPPSGTAEVNMNIKTSLKSGDFSYIPNTSNQSYPLPETYPANFAINYIIKT